MAESTSGILGCLSDGAVRLRVRGRAVAHQCPAAREFVDRGLEAGAVEVRVELAECSYCDSTFLGTLLRIKKAAARVDALGPILVAPSDEIDAIVRRMGLDRLFEVRADGDDPAGDWEYLAEERPGRCSYEFKENVVTAHRELAAASDTCADVYTSIADQAARDLEEERPADE